MGVVERVSFMSTLFGVQMVVMLVAAVATLFGVRMVVTLVAAAVALARGEEWILIFVPFSKFIRFLLSPCLSLGVHPSVSVLPAKTCACNQGGQVLLPHPWWAELTDDTALPARVWPPPLRVSPGGVEAIPRVGKDPTPRAHAPPLSSRTVL
jgi:hypothetical protein